MEEVQAVPVVNTNKPSVSQSKKEMTVIKEQEPDRFSKMTPGGVALAGGLAITSGTGAYKFAKTKIGKVISSVENEIKSFRGELSKPFKGFSNNLKVYGKYGLALLIGATVAMFTFKDSDKDGKLDIIEAINKLIKPAD